MTRIDAAATEADYIDFEFPDEATAERADGVAAFSAHVGATTRIVRADPTLVGSVRTALEAAGIAWDESEAGVSAEDMWPEEPGDAPSGPGL